MFGVKNISHLDRYVAVSTVSSTPMALRLSVTSLYTPRDPVWQGQKAPLKVQSSRVMEKTEAVEISNDFITNKCCCLSQ